LKQLGNIVKWSIGWYKTNGEHSNSIHGKYEHKRSSLLRHQASEASSVDS
jgi:hypothetical protein